MHVGKNRVDRWLLSGDPFPSFGVRGAARRRIGGGQVAVTLRLHGGGEVIHPDCAPDQPYEPSERISLLRGVNIDTKRGAMLVDEFEHLRN